MNQIIELSLIAVGIGIATVMWTALRSDVAERKTSVGLGEQIGMVHLISEENGQRSEIKANMVRVTESMFNDYTLRDFAKSYQEKISDGAVVAKKEDKAVILQKLKQIEQNPQSLKHFGENGRFGFEFIVVKKLLIAFVIEDGKTLRDYIHPFNKNSMNPNESLSTQLETDGLMVRLPKEKNLRAIKKVKHLQNAVFVPREVLIQKGWYEGLKEFTEKFWQPMSLIPYLANVEKQIKVLEKRLKDETSAKYRLESKLHGIAADSFEDSEVGKAIDEELGHKKRVIRGIQKHVATIFPIVGLLIGGYAGNFQFLASFSGAAVGSLAMFFMLYAM